MADVLRALSEANRAGVDFVVAELDTALTFMEVAATSAVEQTVRRNHANARKAYDTVLDLLRRLKPNKAQRKIIDGKLARLREPVIGLQLS